MPLHPEVAQILEMIGHLKQYEMSVEQLRQMAEAAVPPMEQRPAVANVENRYVPGTDGDIPIRIYTPVGGMDQPLPILVYFHGGGMFVGNLDACDVQCRLIANESMHKVISVDYRLAPENPFPAGLEDCYAVTRWASEHCAELNGIGTQLSVGGDSAGGNMAAALALLCRDRQGPRLVKQLLLYPTVDYYELGMDSVYPSIEAYGSNYGLCKEDIAMCWRLYLSSTEDSRNPYACPMQAETLHGLPEALILTAEYDVLRDEGEAYGAKLSQFAVPVRTERVEGLLHGFLAMANLQPVQEAYRKIGLFLRGKERESNES